MKNPKQLTCKRPLTTIKYLLLFTFLISALQTKALNSVVADPDPDMVEWANTSLLMFDIVGDPFACPLDTKTYSAVPYDPATTYEWTVVGAGSVNNNDGTVSIDFPNAPGALVSIFALQRDASGGVLSVNTISVSVENATGLACNDNVTVSLDSNCTTTVTPDMILEGQVYPDDSYSLVLTAPGGNVLPSNVLGASHVGLQIQVTITHDCSGNSCWGWLVVEDKNVPQIDCACPTGNTDPSCEFNCIDLSSLMDGTLAVAQPAVTLGCMGYEVDYQDALIDGVDCGFYTLERTWFVKNNAGVVTDFCKSEYRINPVSFSDIVWPMEVVALSCGSAASPQDVMDAFDLPFTFDNNSTAVIENNEGVPYAYPHYFQSGHPQALNNMICNIVGAYTDQVLEVCDAACSNNSKVARTWTLYDWCSSSSETFLQLIDSSDKTPPTVEGVDITVSTDIWSCVAFINVPSPTLLHDDCSDELITWSASGPASWDVLGLGKSIDTDGDGIIDPYVFTYSATDCCGNVGTYDFNVTVLDLAPPTPVAKQNIILSLTTGSGNGNQGAAKLFATEVDNGSHDNCGAVKLEIRRPEGAPSCASFGIGQYNNNITFNNNGNVTFDDARDTDNGAFVKFCCADAVGYTDASGDYGLQEVILRVYDDGNMDGIVGGPGDNFNETWATVRVENKLPTVISCQNVMIDCHEDHTHPDVVPVPTTIGACETAAVILISTIDNTTECGAGVIIKTWGVDANHDGILDGATCNQIITLNPPTDVFNGVIQWPFDITTSCMTQTEVQKPNWNEGVCDLISWSHTDELFTVVVDACWKVLRHYTVHNECTGQEWTHTQVIKYQDDQDPVLVCQDRVSDAQLDAAGNSLCGSYINLNKSVSDPGSCQSNTFTWHIEVDLWEDGTIDWILTTSQSAFDSNTDNIIPIGNTAQINMVIPELIPVSCTSHTIRYTVGDGCLNTTSCIDRFIVVDRIAPTPYCVSVSTAVMDNGSVTLWANDFDLGAFDDCTDQEDLRFTFGPVLPAPGSSLWNADGKSTSKTFTCTDADAAGLVNVPIYVWDDSCIPNSEICNIVLTLSDCASNPPNNRTIAGNISTEEGTAVNATELSLAAEGIANYPIMTNSDILGDYAFTNVVSDFNYLISGSNERNYMTGVSTLDLVLIQKHILGITTLNSPYKMIAADINDSESISALDLVALRKLILGVYEELPNNTSWKFIDADLQLQLSDPWNYEASREIIDLQGSSLSEDFIGVKIGDVNGSFVSNVNTGNLITRSEKELTLIVEDRNVKKGELVVVPVYAKDFDQIAGFQFTLEHQNLELVDFVSGVLSFNPTNIAALTEDHTTVSWNGINESLAADDEILFSMRFNAKEELVLLDRLKISSIATPSEAYLGQDLQIAEVLLQSRVAQTDNSQIVLLQNEPNPFRTQTDISFILDVSKEVTFTVFDIAGKTIHELTGFYKAGKNTISLHSTDLAASGLLYYKLESGNNSAIRKMILIK